MLKYRSSFILRLELVVLERLLGRVESKSLVGARDQIQAAKGHELVVGESVSHLYCARLERRYRGEFQGLVESVYSLESPR